MEGPEASASEVSASAVAASAWLSTKSRWEPGRACLEPARDLELARDLEEFWTPIRQYLRVVPGAVRGGASASAVELSAWQMAMKVEWREEKGAGGAEVAIGARRLTHVTSVPTSPPVVEAAIGASVWFVSLASAKGPRGAGRPGVGSGSRC